MYVVVLCWVNHVWSSKECACDPSVHLSFISFVLFMFLYVIYYLLILEIESWIIGVCSLYVVSLCGVHIMWSGRDCS